MHNSLYGYCSFRQVEYMAVILSFRHKTNPHMNQMVYLQLIIQDNGAQTV